MKRDVLERRVEAEAKRCGDSVDDARWRLIELGLGAEEARRRAEREAEEQSKLQVDVLLVTVGPTEHRALRAAATSFGLPFERKSGRLRTYYHLGTVGTDKVAAIQVDSMGAFGAGGAAASCIYARTETRATSLVLVGTAFGVDSSTQRVGDVLVSDAVFFYDDRNVVDRVNLPRREGFVARAAGKIAELALKVADREPLRSGATDRVMLDPIVSYQSQILYRRGARASASAPWIARMNRLILQLDSAARAGTAGVPELRVTIGTILSGGTRVESRAFRDALVASVPSADSRVIGGEMEAAGAIAAASPEETDPSWIVVKGIVDFGDASSRAEVDENRARPAELAAQAVLLALGASAILPMVK
jgi:nucleoside phosphorylase